MSANYFNRKPLQSLHRTLICRLKKLKIFTDTFNTEKLTVLVSGEATRKSTISNWPTQVASDDIAKSASEVRVKPVNT